MGDMQKGKLNKRKKLKSHAHLVVDLLIFLILVLLFIYQNNSSCNVNKITMIFCPHSPQTCSDYDVNPSFTQIIVAFSVGLLFIVVFHYRLKQTRDRKIIPRIRLSRASHVPKLERFSHYVGNNICFSISFRLYTRIHKHVSY